MVRILKNPTGSYDCKIGDSDFHATLKGYYVFSNDCDEFNTTLKGSYVYRIKHGGIDTTPSGSNNHTPTYFYKIEFPTRPLETYPTLKGSYVYRKNQCLEYTTPKGSYIPECPFFYKHQIPSGLFVKIMEADIQI